MVTEKIAKLKEIQAKASELSAAIEAERQMELPTLHEKYGFENLNAFIKALKEASAKAAKGGRKGRAAKGGKVAKALKEPKVKPEKAKKRGRTKITPELKQQVKAAVESGKTGSEIAKSFSISLPSVHNIKREFGLVKPRGEVLAAEVASPAPEAPVAWDAPTV